jgi:hypothetical protein
MPELLKWARFEQLVLRSSVISDASGIDSAKGSKTMRLRAGIEYVQHRTVGGYRCVSDQKPVTAPRNRLGAHDHSGLEARERQKIFERFLELPRLHIVGVGPETRVPPLSVARVAPAAPPATERRKVSVSQPGIDQRPLERRLREMRVSRRCGEGAHIEQMRRAFPCQQSEKLLERSSRMTDREKSSGVHAPRSCPPLPSDFQREE